MDEQNQVRPSVQEETLQQIITIIHQIQKAVYEGDRIAVGSFEPFMIHI